MQFTFPIIRAKMHIQNKNYYQMLLLCIEFIYESHDIIQHACQNIFKNTNIETQNHDIFILQ